MAGTMPQGLGAVQLQWCHVELVEAHVQQVGDGGAAGQVQRRRCRHAGSARHVAQVDDSLQHRLQHTCNRQGRIVLDYYLCTANSVRNCTAALIPSGEEWCFVQAIPETRCGGASDRRG